ncbi:MAG: LemA family protein [Mycoplasma sp.]|nr:LemA family protein [Candidatus Hennigella equi]
MLIDTREKNVGPEGFNPNVQNQAIPAKSSVAGLIAFILVSILTIGLLPAIYLPVKRNQYNRQQMQINQAASTIDVQLAQRRDTLVKLVDATKSSLKFEKELLSDVVKMRSMAITKENAAEASDKIERGFGRLLATFEKYPEIKSIQLVKDLMSSADYQEREIAATRRMYNSQVTQFNQEIFTWPACIPAKSLKLHTFPLFAASEAQKQDVSLKLN